MKKNKKIEATQVEQTVANKSNRFLFLLIGFLTFFVFANTIGNDYNMDDELVTRNHPLTSQGMKAIGEIFTSPYYKDDMGYAYGYRPIVHVSFAVEHELFGEKASISHFVNVILYVACVLLFLSLLLKWIGEQNKWIAIVAILFFALHPIHTEVVASIKNRDELLAFLFAILTFKSINKFTQTNIKKWIIFSIVFFTLAILSKKSIYSLAIIIPLFEIIIDNINLKKILVISLSLLIPATIVSSNGDIKMIILLFFLPLTVILFLYFLIIFFKDIKLSLLTKSIIKNDYLLISFSWLIFIVGYWTSFSFLFFFGLIISSFVYLNNFRLGALNLVFASIFLYLVCDHLGYIDFALLFSFFVFFKLKKEELKTKEITIFVLVIIVVFLLKLLNSNSISFQTFFEISIQILLASMLLFKRNILIFISLFLLLVSIFLGIPFFEIDLFITISVGISLLKYFDDIDFKSMNYIFIFITSIFFFQLNYIQVFNNIKLEKSSVVNSPKNDKKTLTKFNEGRKIEYVENTLVEKHFTSESIGTGLATTGEYSKLMVFPYELSFYYGFSKIKTVGIGSFWVWFSFVFHLGLIFLAIWQLKNRPILSIGVGWYLLSILLFSNWFELVAGMVGERLAFTASAGFSMFIGSLLIWIKPEFSFSKPKYLESIVLVILFLFTLKSIQRNSEWKDQMTLMGNDVKHLQNSAQANNLYALNLMKISTSEEGYSQEQRFEMQKRAVSYFKRAVEIYPKFKNAWFDLGRSAFIINDLKNAILGFGKSIELNPDYSEAYFMLCDIYVTQNNKKLFLKTAKSLYKIDKSQKAYVILTDAFFMNGLKDDANQVLKKALKKFPKDNNLLLLYDKINL